MFTLHSYWLQMTYSQAFYKTKNIDDLSLQSLNQIKSKKNKQTNSENRKKRNIKETRAGTIKFPIMQLYVDSIHRVGVIGLHRVVSACMHACVSSYMCPFVLEQRSVWKCVCLCANIHEAGNQRARTG